MTYLFIKNLFEREKFVLFSLKIKNLKKTQKNILVGFFRWFFLGFLGWVFLGGFLMLTLAQGGGSGHVSGLRQGHAQKHAQETRQVGIKTRVKRNLGFPVVFRLYFTEPYFFRRLSEH